MPRSSKPAAIHEQGEHAYGNPLARDHLRWMALRFVRCERRRDDEYERLLEQIADESTRDEARVLRVAAEAVVAATPRLVVCAARRMEPPRIADEVGLPASDVDAMLREEQR